MAVFAGGKIECFVGPIDLGGPDDLELTIVDFIKGAGKSLDIAVQEIDSRPIAEAILEAALGGVRIRMFLEQDYLQAAKTPTVKPKSGETQEQARQRTWWQERRKGQSSKTNRDILAAFLRCGIDVKADLNPDIFHQKFIIRDHGPGGGKSRALLTGSTNFTNTGVHNNLNHVIIFHDARICEAYGREFEEIRQGTFGRLRSRDEPESKVVNLNGVPVRILFAPDHSPELEIIKQMLKCEQRLDFAIFTFSGSSGIDDALGILRSADRQIRGVLDPSQGRQYWAATKWLHHRGIDVFMPDRAKFPNRFGKLHHKLMVVDSAIVIAGSMNYTAQANLYNDENIFVLGSPYDLPKSKGGPVDHQACQAIAEFFRTEIDRIIAKSDRYAEPPE